MKGAQLTATVLMDVKRRPGQIVAPAPESARRFCTAPARPCEPPTCDEIAEPSLRLSSGTTALLEHARERCTTEVAAAHHAHDAFAGEPVAQLHRRHQRRGAGALGKVVRRPQREPHAAGELLFGERDDIVELLLQDAEWQ